MVAMCHNLLFFQISNSACYCQKTRNSNLHLVNKAISDVLSENYLINFPPVHNDESRLRRRFFICYITFHFEESQSAVIGEKMDLGPKIYDMTRTVQIA